VGAAQLAAGNVRAALETYQSLIAEHPAEAVHHVQMASALLAAGIGDKARREAEQATKLEPTSAMAFRMLGWADEHNSIGTRFARGFDWKGAAAAYKKAAELDEKSIDSQIDLGILYEFAPSGERYGDVARLEDAIPVYKAARERDKDAFESSGYLNNLYFDLLYSHHYKELEEELAKLPPDVSRVKFGIAAAVAQSGVQAGLKEADKANGDSSARNEAISAAGQLLIHMRLYSQAAEMLTAGMQTDTDAAQRSRQVEIFRKLEPYEKHLLPATDPRSTIQRFYAMLFDTELPEERTAALLSKNSFGSAKVRKKVLDSLKQGQGSMRMGAVNAELPLIVLEDLTIGSMQYSVEGNDDIGYHITVQSVGA
jgi:tetratricopeptide (TPR) repeat protein